MHVSVAAGSVAEAKHRRIDPARRLDAATTVVKQEGAPTVVLKECATRAVVRECAPERAAPIQEAVEESQVRSPASLESRRCSVRSVHSVHSEQVGSAPSAPSGREASVATRAAEAEAVFEVAASARVPEVRPNVHQAAPNRGASS